MALTLDEQRERDRMRKRMQRRGTITCRQPGCPEIAPLRKWYCEAHQLRPRTTSGVCARCGVAFTVDYKRKSRRSYRGSEMYCSPRCANARHLTDDDLLDRRVALWKQRNRITMFRCRTCNKRHVVVGDARRRSFCDRQCWLVDASARIMGLYYESSGGQDWRRSLVTALRERDGDDCWLCQSPMHFVYGNKDDRATIDHVMPRSKGGADTSDNLRLAHWRCNLDKRDTVIQ